MLGPQGAFGSDSNDPTMSGKVLAKNDLPPTMTVLPRDVQRFKDITGLDISQEEADRINTKVMTHTVDLARLSLTTVRIDVQERLRTLLEPIIRRMYPDARFDLPPQLPTLADVATLQHTHAQVALMTMVWIIWGKSNDIEYAVWA